MPYDSSLDECLFIKVHETDTDRVNVSVYSYNKGTKKLQLTREKKADQGDFKFAKLGRMTKEEVDFVLPFIQEARTHME